jgi:4-hydroxythreonine-4-phosphate dehydrogenase
MIIKAGINFQGHTEVIGQVFNNRTFLCMYSKQLTTVLLTNHIPLKKVSSFLKKVDYEQLILSILKFRSLIRNEKPVAMLGLNPHAGEGGKIGDEEIFLKERIREMNRQGLKTEGPFSADSFFMNKYYENFSVALACYHDQGLIPFKALSGLNGVNVTLGVPQLRVSPDHGTAYKSIRNNEKLSSDGIKSALKFAIKWGQKWAQL